MVDLKKLNIFVVVAIFFLANFLFITPSRAAGQLIKSKNVDTVYYLDADGFRHPFPNVKTYQSWYGTDFSKVTIVSNNYLATLPLGKNITMRPGKYLVKVPSAPAVYAVQQGGVLRQITDLDLLETIYGSNWQKRLVDIPEGFFGDYLIGEVIDKEYKLPDDLLFYQSDTGKYFYKQHEELRPFDSMAAIAENNFLVDDAIKSVRSYYVRQRPIVGLDFSIFNPVANPNVDNRDCENKKLKAAVVFLTDGAPNSADVSKIQAIKQAIPERFKWVTSDFSSMDVSYPTSLISDDGYLIEENSDGVFGVNNELINTFYDKNPDQFDFLLVFTNFKINHNKDSEIAYFVPMSNLQKGIGRDTFNLAEIYGSGGKLKGVIMMGDIDKYDFNTETEKNEVLNVVMHEFLHQWAAYISFKDNNNQASQALLRSDDFSHWSIYDSFISPLGGSGWNSNGNGTYTSLLSQLSDSGLRQYSQLDLYLMGLIPYQVMPSVFYLTPETPDFVANTITASSNQVTIDQIIAANGKVECLAK